MNDSFFVIYYSGLPIKNEIRASGAKEAIM